MIYALYRVCSV